MHTRATRQAGKVTLPYSLALVALLPFHMVRLVDELTKAKIRLLLVAAPRLRSLPGPALLLCHPRPTPPTCTVHTRGTTRRCGRTALRDQLVVPAALLPFHMVSPFEATRRTMSPALGDPLAGILCSTHLTMLLGGRGKLDRLTYTTTPEVESDILLCRSLVRLVEWDTTNRVIEGIPCLEVNHPARLMEWVNTTNAPLWGITENQCLEIHI